MIIAFVQTKGGTGKTTLAMCTVFSNIMMKKFTNSALVELDMQNTLGEWWKEREELGRESKNVSFYNIANEGRQEIENTLNTLLDNHDLLVLDVPGESTGKFHTQLACAIADIVIIPMRTSDHDEKAFLTNLKPIIEKVAQINPDRKQDTFYILPTFIHPQQNKVTLKEYIESIAPDFIQCLDTPFPQRPIFENFCRNGSNLHEYKSFVKNNKRELTKAKQGIQDIEDISKNLLLLTV